MTSMINVGELVGSLSAAPLNDYIGRKGVFMTGTLAIIVGVVLQLVTTSSAALITAGRAILGFGVGNFSATSPLYMGVCLRLLFIRSLYRDLNTDRRFTGNCARVFAKPFAHVLATHSLHLPNPCCRHQPRCSQQPNHLCIPLSDRIPAPLPGHHHLRYLVGARIPSLASSQRQNREGREFTT